MLSLIMGSILGVFIIFLSMLVHILILYFVKDETNIFFLKIFNIILTP